MISFFKKLCRRNSTIGEEKKNKKEDEFKVYVTRNENKECLLRLCTEVMNEHTGKHIYIRLRGDNPKTEHLAKMMKRAKARNIGVSIIADGNCINPQIVRLCRAYCRDIYLVWEQNDRTLEAIKLLHDCNITFNILIVLNNATLDEANWRVFTGFMCKPDKICFVYDEKPPMNVDDMRVRKLFDGIAALNEAGYIVCFNDKMMNFAKNIGRNNEGARLFDEDAMILEPA